MVPFPFIDSPPSYQPLPSASPLQMPHNSVFIPVEAGLPSHVTKGKGKASQPTSRKSNPRSQTFQKSGPPKRGGKRKAEDELDSFLFFPKKLVIVPSQQKQTDPIISIIQHSQHLHNLNAAQQKFKRKQFLGSKQS